MKIYTNKITGAQSVNLDTLIDMYIDCYKSGITDLNKINRWLSDWYLKMTVDANDNINIINI